MKHDHVLKKSNFDPSPGSAGNHVAVFMILFNLICNTTMFWKKVEFLPSDPIPRVGEEGLRANICYHVDAFLILFSLICNMAIFWTSWILTYLPHTQGLGMGGVRAKYLKPCCCIHDSLKLICNMTMFWKSWILTSGSDREVCKQNICYHLAAFLILFNLICNMTIG